MSELRVSNDVISDTSELQRRLEDDGYLFFRKLLPADALLELRRQMLSVIQQGGWLMSGTDLMQGIAEPAARTTEGDPEYTAVYHQVYKLQLFHEIAHNRQILDVLERVRECSIMPLPQKVARMWFPQFSEHTTPTHQDFVHFQGSFDNLTCWSPVGDCPRELGGLAVLRGSHLVNRILDHHFSLGAGSLNVDPLQYPDLGTEWHTTDYETGDTLMFPALTIHKALPNLTNDRLRISLDNRYQRVKDPIADHMLDPHLSAMSPLTWEDIYRHWTKTDLQYYWKQFDNPVLPKITKYVDIAFDEAVAQSRAGDEHARLHLRRIAAREPHTDRGKTALAILSDS
ncbi:MAG: phytanoyl-CoA dioxygenase family protein [Fuerstiella sp.]|nr:phytanoyl-CoA dioxygenase family protein [Fuerstiella sp.]